MLKVWLVVVLIGLLATAELQHDLLSWAAAQQAVLDEANEDARALQDDTRALRFQLSAAPSWMLGQWQETVAGLEALRVDAHADAQLGESALKRTARRIAHGRENIAEPRP